MRIVQILPELNEGGVERGTVELNREFVIRDLESIVISNGGKMAAQIDADGGRHIRANVSSKNPLTAFNRVSELRRILADLKPDIVHARSRVPAWLCVLARRKLDFPFVTTVHGLNSINRYSKVMTCGDRVICVSEVVQSHISDNYSLDEGKLRVIQRGVDMNYFAPEKVDQEFETEFKERYRLKDRFVVTSVGRITWLKDYETFIRAIAACQNEIPNIIGVIVGGAREDKLDYLESLKQLAEQEGVSDKIIFTGSQSNMREIYHLSDVVVNASLKMGNVGRTVSEALAMNCPVLATTFPGLNNIIQDEKNGFIIGTKDPDDLAAKIQAIQAHPLSGIRQSLPEEFTLARMVEDTLSVYRELQ